MKHFTVKQLADLAGVSVRTIHFYDQIGLLIPGSTGDNGYRYYNEEQLDRLQQILFFRELEFPLAEIKRIILADDFDIRLSLANQKKMLAMKQNRINNLLKTIDKTINSMKGGKTMNTDDKFSAFNDPSYRDNREEIEKRWGNTEAYKQSKRRVAKMTKADLEKIKKESEEITRTIAGLMKKGLTPEDKEVQEQIRRHFNQLKNFYEPTAEMYRGLGQMYVDDARFTKNYEKVSEGLAAYMRDAMNKFADNLK